MAENTRICQCEVSTVFVFDTLQYQNAANTVYESKKAVDPNINPARTGAFRFKSDYERMQYLIGKYARYPASS